ncbi:MAG TPA: exodeoxyribonuclease VII small subunit [Gemmatimonadaceae bacterium]|jgi:exodeoxyribonuclease VII small subunit
MSAEETFEQRLARLEEIASQLERDGVELARALELFEEGIEHLRGAAAQLTNAEARVQRLIEQADGSFDVVERE